MSTQFNSLIIFIAAVANLSAELEEKTVGNSKTRFAEAKRGWRDIGFLKGQRKGRRKRSKRVQNTDQIQCNTLIIKQNRRAKKGQINKQYNGNDAELKRHEAE